VEQSPLLLWPFIGLLYQPWMLHGDDCMEWVAGETEILRENLLQCRSVHNRSQLLQLEQFTYIRYVLGLVYKSKTQILWLVLWDEMELMKLTSLDAMLWSCNQLHCFS
jgi:hypothetical protein